MPSRPHALLAGLIATVLLAVGLGSAPTYALSGPAPAFSQVEPQKPARTVGLTHADTHAFLGYDPTTDQARFSTAWVRENGVGPNTVVVIERSSEFPNGLALWITRTSTTGDVTLAHTRPARLTEILAGVNSPRLRGSTSGAQEVQGTLGDPDVARAARTRVGYRSTASTASEARDVTGEPISPRELPKVTFTQPFSRDFPLGFTKTITKDSCTNGTFGSSPSSCHWEGEGSVDARFGLTVTPQGELSVTTQGLKLTDLSLTGGTALKGDANVSTHGPIKGHATWKLADLKFPLVIPIGGVPITVNIGVSPEVSLRVDADGNATASLGGFDASYTGMGIRYTDGKGFSVLKGEPASSTRPPSVTGEGNIHTRLDLTPNVSVDLLGLIGVKGGIGPHLNADFHISPVTPVCLLGFGAQGSIGLITPSLGKIPIVGWFLGGIEKPLREFLERFTTLTWSIPSFYTSPNLCAANPIAIGDRVWIDRDGNGIQDPGEPGLAGARVTLLRGVDKLVAKDPTSARYKRAFVAATTTDASGHYRFDADPQYRGTTTPAGEVKNVGKLMPGEYTLVVTPPDPQAADYPYSDLYPGGFTITKRYRPVRVRPHTIEEIAKDSGGKYAWNTDSYSSLFDGTRYQDRAPISLALTEPSSGRERVAAWLEEYARTGGYNDTVDWGFVPRSVATPTPEPTAPTPEPTGDVTTPAPDPTTPGPEPTTSKPGPSTPSPTPTDDVTTPGATPKPTTPTPGTSSTVVGPLAPAEGATARPATSPTRAESAQLASTGARTGGLALAAVALICAGLVVRRMSPDTQATPTPSR